MNDRALPRRMQESVSIQPIGTESLVYDERRHMAFCLNESSSAIWLLADGQHTVAQISVAASVQLNAPVSEDLVLFAIAELRRDGLMEPSTVAESVPALSRRAMLRRLGVSGALLLPMIAAVLAPTAAQAYNGCVDCSSSRASKARRRQAASAPSQ
jgi:hypothetical protein